MSDLISREAMLEAIDKRERIMRKTMPFEINDDELRPTLNSVREFVKNRPAVDAELVRHGRWYWKEEERISDCYIAPVSVDCNDHWACSVCDEDIAEYLRFAVTDAIVYMDDPDNKPSLEYCPHCGAVMNMEHEEEKE